MQFRSATAAATLVIGTFVAQGAVLTAGAGPAFAEPASPTTPENITYSAKLIDKAVVTTLRGGTFALSKALDTEVAAGGSQRLSDQNGTVVDATGATVDPAKVVNVVDVKDSDGKVQLTLPLAFHLGPIDIPVKPELQQNDTVLALTPDKPAGLSISQPLVAKPIASDVENQRAMGNFSSQFGLASSIGGFVGTALGAGIGCVATIAAGCVAGLATGAGIGGIIGTIVVGGPVLIASGVDLVSTLAAPNGTSKWSDKAQAAQTSAAAAPTATPAAPTPQPAAQPAN